MSFIFTYVFTSTSTLYFFIWSWNSIYYPFISACKNLFIIFVEWIYLWIIFFSLFGNVLISSSFFKDNFAGYRILSWQSVILALLIYYSVIFWPPYSQWNVNCYLTEIPCRRYVVLLITSRSFFVSAFKDLTKIVLCVDLFVVIPLRIHWASWIEDFFFKFWKFGAIITSDILSTPFSLSLLLGLPFFICWPTWWCPVSLWGLLFFFYSFFHFLPHII